MTRVIRVAVLGSTGSLGRVVARALAGDSAFALKLVVRPGKRQEVLKIWDERGYAHVDVVEAPYDDPQALTQALSGVTVVIDALASSMDFEATKVFIDAAVAAGVGRYIPNQFIAMDMDLHPEEKGFNKKRKINAYLQQLADQDKMDYTAFYTGYWLDYCLIENTSIGVNLYKKTASRIDGGTARLTMTPHCDVVAFLLAALKPTSSSDTDSHLLRLATRNRVLRVGSMTVTWNEMLAAIEKEFGPFETSEGTSVALRQQAAEAAARGDWYGTIYPDLAAMSAEGKMEMPNLDNALFSNVRLQGLTETAADIYKRVQAGERYS